MDHFLYGTACAEADPGQFPHVTEWLATIRDLGVKALVVLGPDPFGDTDSREVFCACPDTYAKAAQALCQSDAYGKAWRESKSPLAAWLCWNDQDSLSDWRTNWNQHGLNSMVRIELPLPMGRSFECFVFCNTAIPGRSEAADICYAMMSAWPMLKDEITSTKLGISARERESLVAAADGLTARETSLRMRCTERTVTHHWSSVMRKMQTKNKVAAVQRASWLGLI